MKRRRSACSFPSSSAAIKVQVFLYVIGLLFIQLLPACAAQRGAHQIYQKDSFVILDGEQAQRFRLFGFLPYLHTNVAHVVLITSTLFLLVLLSTLFLLRRRHQGTSFYLWSQLPDSLIRLAFYVQLEASSYFNVFCEDVMSAVNAPLMLGLNLASRLSSGNIAGSYVPSYDTSSDEDYGRAHARRRHRPASLLNIGASTSKVTAPPPKAGSYYPGLWNTGNSCFLNSTLQNLAGVAPLEKLLQHVIEQAEEWDVPTPVTDALYDVVAQLNTPLASRSAIIPRQLTDALSNLPQTKVGSFFYAHQQQDAHELLVLVTSALDEEIKAIEREKEVVRREKSIGLCAVFAPAVLPSSTRATSFLNPFRSLVAQRTACLDCGYVEAVRHYPTDELSLTVPPRSGSATTIEACLANWSKLEVVDWICFHCSIVRTIERTRLEASHLAALAKGSASAEANGHSPLSPSAKKKSGAKRKKLRETKEKESILLDILQRGLSEDEEETKSLLSNITLDRTFSRAATKQVMLARTSKVLILHLNRSSYSASNFGASKNNTPVLFDEELDVGDIVTGGDLSVRADRPISRGVTPFDGVEADAALWTTMTTNGKKTKASVHSNGTMQSMEAGYLDGRMNVQASLKTRYRLSGIVVHYGGHSSGHYVAFRRRQANVSSANGSYTTQDLYELDDRVGNGKKANGHAARIDEWYRISDDSVSRCSWHDVRVQNPFILFYERIDDDDDESESRSKAIADRSEVISRKTSSSVPSYAGPHVPNGFEAFARTAGRPILAPRVIQRWETLPFDRVVEKHDDDKVRQIKAHEQHKSSANGAENGHEHEHQLDMAEKGTS